MSRPTYMLSHTIPVSRPVSKKERQTATYRCRRLQGLINLYYWALDWTVHHNSKWSLGVPAYPFDLGRQELRLLGIETLADLDEHDLAAITDRVVIKGKHQGRPIVGSIRLDEIERREDVDGLSVRPFTWHTDSDKLSKSPPAFIESDPHPTFTEADIIQEVDFRCDENPIPWSILSGCLEVAYKDAERHLASAGIPCTGPPFFEQMWGGHELLEHISVRKLDPKVVLLDLERRRREFQNDMETVLGNARGIFVPDPITWKMFVDVVVGLERRSLDQLKGKHRAPDPRIPHKGGRPAIFSYADLRDWLNALDKGLSCPDSYSEALKAAENRGHKLSSLHDK